MNIRKFTTLLSLLIFTGLLSAQNGTIYEFLGKVTTHNKKAKGVTIQVFEGDSCFSNYETKSNGKFAFYGEGSKSFILQFKKPGYLTKQLIVNTTSIDLNQDQMNKFKFEINLVKMKKGQKEDEFISKVDVIEPNRISNSFTYKSNRNKEYYFKSLNETLSNL